MSNTLRPAAMREHRLGSLLMVVLVPLLAGCPGIPGLPGGAPILVPTIMPPAMQGAMEGSFATVGDTVPLTATSQGGSGAVTFAWTQIAGPPVTITDGNTANASFVPLTAGKYRFRLSVTDSGSPPQTVTSDTEVITVGDIQFVVGSATVAGNPAVIEVFTDRDDSAAFDGRVSVFDPDYVNDNETVMTVRYEVISFPSAARAQDISLNRDFDTLSNQGTGDNDAVGNAFPTLDGVVSCRIRPNPEAAYDVLTNLGTIVGTFGRVVPGDYTFRATVTNPMGVERFRDLLVTVVAAGIAAPSGVGGAFRANGAGPATVAVKELPAGSPGRVTDKVMTADQSATMTVAVFPATTTSYRFYLVDNNGVAHNVVTQSATQVAATGAPTDITLTIASQGGLPIGTHTLRMDAFDGYSNVNNVPVTVNDTPGNLGSGTPVRFHVTADFDDASSINAALVGSASNNSLTPIMYEGWSGTPNNYGNLSALADVNLDGAADIITSQGNGFRINTAGFVDGSTAALRHPVNSSAFDNSLNAPTSVINNTTTPNQLAVGDLNNDDLPDVAISFVDGGVGTVQVFFHTGNPAQPYSNAQDQTLFIRAPIYLSRLFIDQANANNIETDPGNFAGVTLFNPPEPGRNEFGTRIAIADINGDSEADLIVSDPGFSRMKTYTVTGPRPAALKDLYNSKTGRVYVFAGNSTVLQPGRPDVVTSVVLDTATLDITMATEPTAVALSESNVAYQLVFEGANDLDFIGHSLAASTSLAVGSPLAVGNGQPFVRLVFNLDIGGGTVADGATVATTYGGVTRTYEFDSNGALVNAMNIAVDISGAGNNLPVIALGRLRDAVNADTDRVMNVANDPVLTLSPIGGDTAALIFTGIDTGEFGSLDEWVRSREGQLLCNVTVNGLGPIIANGANVLAFNRDGIVERQSGGLGNAVVGTANSNMGLGATLAVGNLNGSGGDDDLVIGALDTGDPRGNNDGFAADGISANDDGGVFVVLDGSTTLPAAVSGVGANTLGAPAGVTPTSVGAKVAAGDVNSDGIDDVLFTEPGFDRVYVIRGASPPAASPNIVFEGVVFNNSLPHEGRFLFGDITGDTQDDWILLSSSLNFGFAGFDR